MFKHLLLPNRFKMIGWHILIPATVSGIYLHINHFDINWINTRMFAIISDSKEALFKTEYFTFIKTDITNTVVAIAFIIGALLVGFSKEKKEDEFISELRLSSLLWAVWINYVLLILAFLFVYGISFLRVMVYNIFTVLIIFIARFNYILYKSSKMESDEK